MRAANSRLHRIAAIVAATATLGACADATGPGSDGEQQNQDYTVRVTLNSVSSPAICEEAFTDFDGGEFVWSVAVTWPSGSEQVLDQTSGYPSPGGFQTLQQGQAKQINKSLTQTVRSTNGTSFSVSVRASEVDFNLFGGNPSADTRLSDARETGVHMFDAAGWQQGSFDVLVRTNDSCQFRASYTVTATQ